VRIAAWILVGAIAVVLVQAGQAGAASRSSPSHDAAVDVYVEEFPTAAGAIPADVAGATAGTATRTAGTPGSGDRGLIALGVILVGLTAAVLVVRSRSRGDRADSA
jgi:hypothetical protein